MDRIFAQESVTGVGPGLPGLRSSKLSRATDAGTARDGARNSQRVAEGQVDGRTGGRADGRTGGRAEGRTGGREDWWTGGQEDGQTGGRSDRQAADRRVGGREDGQAAVRRAAGQQDGRAGGHGCEYESGRRDGCPRVQVWVRVRGERRACARARQGEAGVGNG